MVRLCSREASYTIEDSILWLQDLDKKERFSLKYLIYLRTYIVYINAQSVAK